MSDVRALLEANGWALEQTGGGCTAYTKADPGGPWYWMLTRQDSPTAPELLTDRIVIGRYRLGLSDPAEVTDYTTLQLWADSHYLRDAGPASPPEPTPPQPDHDCTQHALRGVRCGICGAFLQDQ